MDEDPRAADLARRLGARVARADELEPGDVDLVVVALPTQVQPDVCALLLARGLRVLCEKPVGADLGAVAALGVQRRARENLAVGYMLHHHPFFGAFTSWAARADVRAVRIRTVAHKDEVTAWRADASGGGVVVVNAVHALELVGAAVPGEVEVLDAWSSSGLYGSGVPELVHASYRIGGAVHVQLETYWSPWLNDEGLNDRDFDLEIDAVATGSRRHWRNWTLRSWDRGERERVDLVEPLDLFAAQARSALDFARGGPPDVGIEAAVAPIELATSINELLADDRRTVGTR
ncbi:hypothetical protein GCM10025864_03140 [Luteimicrobium album]|uniref:Gfo/Idh/MocA-like oxidoreductase N-terminal domain-containing protein n=1 Tax=Luteimicrobium album TaxID=1054550 RepID=A0ABQ6HVP3_9MICO|nr:hypothetical protein GCM10025864_03140 [Luteimicrobium album]